MLVARVARRLVTLWISLVVVALGLSPWAAPARAQTPTEQPMLPDCTTGCTGNTYGIAIHPDGDVEPKRVPNTGGYQAVFTVYNTGNAVTETIDLVCTGLTNVTCTGLSASYVTVAPGASATVTATYSVGAAGTGTLKLTGTPSSDLAMPDNGTFSVPVSPYNVATTPDGQAVTSNQGTTGLTAVFTVNNIGSVSDTYTFTCTSGATSVVTCGAAPSSITLAAGASASVTQTYTTLSTGVATLTLTARGNTSGGAVNAGSYVVTSARHQLAVTPDGAAEPVRRDNSAGFTTTFAVANQGSVAETLAFTCTGTGSASCAGTPAGLTLAAGASQNVTVTYNTGVAGSGRITLGASASGVSDTGYVTVQAEHYELAMTPSPDGTWASDYTHRGGAGTEKFTVTNRGTGAATVTLACSYEPYLAGCTSPSPAIRTLAPGQTDTVLVGYAAGTLVGGGRLRLTASTAQEVATTSFLIHIYDDTPAQIRRIASTAAPATREVEAGPYTYTITLQNQGSYRGSVTVQCGTSSPQLVCDAVSPEMVTLDPMATQMVTVGYRTLGRGTFNHVVWVDGNEPIVDEVRHTSYTYYDSLSTTVTTIGAPMVTHLSPMDRGPWLPGDTLRAFFSHDGGMNVDSLKVLIDDTARAAIVAGNSFKVTLDGIVGGTHTWKTYACALTGRCEWFTSTFTAVAPPTPFALDDNLPPPQGQTGIAGLLGGLKLPPMALRGCPVNGGAPEIRLTSPTSFLPQLTSAGSSGLVFAASVSFNDPLNIGVVHVDRADTSSVTCSNYAYVEDGGFDWSYWKGTNPNDPLWDHYPSSYGDRLEEAVGTLALESAPDEGWSQGSRLELALAGPVHGPRAMDPISRPHHAGGARRQSIPWIATVARLGARAAGRVALAGPDALSRALAAYAGNNRGSARMFLPDPGAIDTASYQLTLNGTPIVQNGNPVTALGVTWAAQPWRGGSNVLLPSTSSLLHKYHFDSPAADSGGWNEVVATISDNTGHTSSVRAHFVHLDPGVYHPLAMTALRDFDHLDQGDCAAFGIFQCGGVMLTQEIPGFVTRDKGRGLHLVYRSASQRAATALPIQMHIDRAWKAPDSLKVVPRVGGVAAGKATWYAGVKGALTGENNNNLWENADEDRVLAAELEPAATAGPAIRAVTASVTGFYGALGEHTDSLTQEVVQLYLSDTTATRFGQGWQLAELSRLVLGQTSRGRSAAVWVSGDGSYSIYRKAAPTDTAFQTPVNETARLVQPSVADSGAAYVLFLDNGASIGYRWDGWQVWTRDLVGNQTTYNYLSSGSSRLASIVDPTQKRFVFGYDGTGNVASVAVQTSAAPTDTTTMATFTYVPGGTDGAQRLGSVKIWRSESTGDVTRYTYLADAPGAYVDSVVDPRSSGTKVVATKVTYDPALWTPTNLTGPADRWGPTNVQARDPWRRASPRYGYGRDLSTDSTQHQALDRLVYPSQLVGATVDMAGKYTEYAVDRFGGPTWVRVVAPQPVMHDDFSFTFYGGDQTRHIERDSVTGRVLKIVAARDSAAIADSVMYRYDALGRVDTIIKNTARYPVPVGAELDTVTFVYDSLSLAPGGAWCSRLKTMTDVMKSVTTTVYGTSGAERCLPQQMIGITHDTTTFYYDTLAAGSPWGVRPVKVRSPIGVMDSVAYDAGTTPTWNTALHVRLADGARSTVTYDGFGRPVSSTDPSGAPSVVQYDRSGRVLRQKSGTGPLAPTTAMTYDAAGQVIQTDVYASEDAELEFPLDSAAVQSTRTFYDLLGRVDSILNPGSRSAPAGQHRARRQYFVRDRSGTPRWEYPGNGAYIARQTDWAGRLKYQNFSQVDPSMSVDGERFADDATAAVYNSVYMKNNNLSAGQVYEYGYDNKGRRIWMRGVELGLGQVSDSLTHQAWAYSRVGALIADTMYFKAGVKRVRSYQYNRRGQRTAVIDAITPDTLVGLVGEASGSTRFYYNDATAQLDSLVDLVDSAGTTVRNAKVRYQYDRFGRDSVRTVYAGGGTDPMQTLFAYDALGRAGATTTQNSKGIWYQFATAAGSYDSLDRLVSYSEVRGDPAFTVSSRTYAYTNQYDPNGTGRLISSQKTGSTGALSSNSSWQYDALGNKTKEYNFSGLGDAKSCNGAWDTLTYAPDNQILSSNAGGGCRITQYWADQAGNRLVQQDDLHASQSVTFMSKMSYTAARQLHFALTPRRDELGNYDLNWNWYDGNGVRIITMTRLDDNWMGGYDPKQGVSQYYFYDGSDVSMTLDQINGAAGFVVKQRFVTGGVDQVLAGRFRDIHNGYKSLVLVSDRAGAPVAAVRGDGTTECTDNVDRNMFGGTMNKSGWCGIDLGVGFAGASTPTSQGGYTYMRNRWYDPQTGRFLTQDPIGLAGGVNLYAYAGNNPVAYTDPFGLCPYTNRTYDVKDCPKNNLGNGFRMLAASNVPAAQETIHAIADYRIQIKLKSGSQLQKACGSQAKGCFDHANTITMDKNGTPSAMAARVTHEATHVILDGASNDPGMGEQDVQAWNRALDVYGSLPVQDDPMYDAASQQRTQMGLGAWDAHVKTEACKVYNPC